MKRSLAASSSALLFALAASLFAQQPQRQLTPEQQAQQEATRRPASIQADNGAGLTAGIIGLCNQGQPRKPDDGGALRAWAWGASRALDYFETDKAVDAKQVGIEGLSRYGKAALVALAYDRRSCCARLLEAGVLRPLAPLPELADNSNGRNKADRGEGQTRQRQQILRLSARLR